MKYLIVRDQQEKEHAIIFPEELVHADIARVHRATNLRVVSAGFCTIGDQVSAWGESESLRGMKSRPEDLAIIASRFES